MRKLALLICGIALTTISFAQKQKIGHVDFNDILQDMYVKDSVQFKLQSRGQQLQKMLQNQQMQLQKEINEFLAQKDSMPKQIAKLTEESLSKRMQELEQVVPQRYQQALQEEELTLVEPLQEKIKAAIAKVSKVNGLTYVVESSAILFVGEGAVEITKLVRIELGLPEVSATESNPQVGQ